MLLRTLWSWLSGYVIIRAEGAGLEVFINEAVTAGIPLWRLERPTRVLLVTRTKAAAFRHLARLGRRRGVRVNAVLKGGLPFVFGQVRRRRTWLAVGLLCAFTLYGLAQFVWFVDVYGTEEVDPEAVLTAAASGGLRPGALRGALQRDQIVHRLHEAVPRLAWAGIDVRGTRAVVRVVERTVADPQVWAPGHIVAARDGIVDRLVITQGQGLVTVGDTVLEGQLLISGMLTPGSAAFAERLEEGSLPVVRAEGSVWGRSWYQGDAEIILDLETDGPVTPEWVVAATERAAAQATEAVVGLLPPGAEVRGRDVVVHEQFEQQPAVVRVSVTVTAYQNLGRFLPVEDSAFGGDGARDDDDGPENGQFQRPKQ